MALTAWRAACAAANAGTADAKAVFIGDSLSAGCSSTGNQMGSNARSMAFVSQLAPLMSGVPVSAASVIGDGGAWGDSKTHAQYDYRVTQGAGWTTSTWADSAAGGGIDYAVSAGGSALAINFGVEFDRIRIVHSTYPGAPNYTVDIGGATLATLQMNAAASMTLAPEISCSLGTNTIYIRSTGDYGFIAAVYVYKSATKQALLMNAGWYGSSTADWSTTADNYDPLDVIGVLAPHLTVIELGGNDMLQARGETAFKADLGTIVDAAKASGSVLLLAPHYLSSTEVAYATQDNYTTWISDVATAKSVDFADIKTESDFATYAIAVSNGYMDVDGKHGTQAGYGRWAQFLRNIIDIRSPVLMPPARRFQHLLLR